MESVAFLAGVLAFGDGASCDNSEEIVLRVDCCISATSWNSNQQLRTEV